MYLICFFFFFRFIERFSKSLIQICGYVELVDIVEQQKKTAFSSENNQHEETLLEVRNFRTFVYCPNQSVSLSQSDNFTWSDQFCFVTREVGRPSTALMLQQCNFSLLLLAGKYQLTMSLVPLIIFICNQTPDSKVWPVQFVQANNLKYENTA